jgi:hypothetical protein
MSFADAQAVARRVAERVSARAGETLWLRDYPAAAVGEVGRVVIGVERAALHRVVAAVSDLGSMCSAVVEERGPGLCGYSLGDEAKEEVLAGAIAAAMAARGDAWPLGLLDAAVGVLDALGQRLGVAGSGWRWTTWGEWDDRQQGASVELFGEHAWPDLISIRQAHPDAVRVVVPAAAIGAPERERVLATPGALVDALGGIIDDVRAAVDARAAFRVRPDGIAAFGGRLLDALRARGVAAARLVVAEGAGFPRAWPTASIDRVALAESAAGVTVTIDGAFGPYPTFAEAARDLDRIAAEARVAADRLRPDRLVVGRIYRVIAPIRAAGASVEPGARLRYLGVDHVPREGFAIHRFDGLELAEYADADAAILARLHELLALADPS